MYRIRKAIFRRMLAGCTRKQKILRLFVMIFRPLLMLFLSVRYAFKFSKRIAVTCGVNAAGLFLDMLASVNIYNMTPWFYLRYQLYLNENKAKKDSFLYGNEANVVFLQSNKNTYLDLVDDKTKFYEICGQSGIAIPAIFGIVERGMPLPELPANDVIVKPAHGARGAGIELWCYKEDGGYEDNSGQKFDVDTFKKYLNEKADQVKDRLILQKRIVTSDQLSTLSKNAPVVARIVTVRDVAGTVSFLNGVMLIPIGSEFLRPGIIVSPVDQSTGMLTEAVSYGIVRKAYPVHPDTNQPITGTRVPHWKEAVEAVVKAHSFFPEYFSLGWDVAISDEGPVILEANKIWDVETSQRPAGIPLGDTVFSEFCAVIIGKNC